MQRYTSLLFRRSRSHVADGPTLTHLPPPRRRRRRPSRARLLSSNGPALSATARRADRHQPSTSPIREGLRAQHRSPRDSGSATKSRSIDRLVRPLNSTRLLHPETSPAASPSPNRARGILACRVGRCLPCLSSQWGAPPCATGLCLSTSSTRQPRPWSPSGGGSMSTTLFRTGSGSLAARWGCNLRSNAQHQQT